MRETKGYHILYTNWDNSRTKRARSRASTTTTFTRVPRRRQKEIMGRSRQHVRRATRGIWQGHSTRYGWFVGRREEPDKHSLRGSIKRWRLCLFEAVEPALKTGMDGDSGENLAGSSEETYFQYLKNITKRFLAKMIFGWSFPPPKHPRMREYLEATLQGTIDNLWVKSSVVWGS